MAKTNPDKLGEQLSAYLDGELSSAEREVVESRLRDDSAVREMLDSLRRNAAALGDLPRYVAPETMLDEVTVRIERSQLLDDAPQTERQKNSPSGAFRSLLMTAALVAIAVGGGLWGILQNEQAETPISVADAKKTESKLDVLGKPLDETASNREEASARGARLSPDLAAGIQERRVLEEYAADSLAEGVSNEMELELSGEQSEEGISISPSSAASSLQPLKTYSFADADRDEKSQDVETDSQRQFAFAQTFRQLSQLPSAQSQLEIDVPCADERDAARCAGRLNRFVANQLGALSRDRLLTEDDRSDGPSFRKDESGAAGTFAREQVVRVPLSQLTMLAEVLQADRPPDGDVTLSSEGVTQATGWLQVQFVLAAASDPTVTDSGWTSGAMAPERFARGRSVAAESEESDTDALEDGRAEFSRRDTDATSALRKNSPAKRKAGGQEVGGQRDDAEFLPTEPLIADPIVDVVIRFSIPPRPAAAPSGAEGRPTEDPKRSP